MIIGTAGHIDHGKTALVKALTGVDTDRLPEEKARGITLDLGFAYTTTATGESLGFVDVPGHEKLVHTMLAGAGGIDYVLLLVAADDGPKPQTLEHLQIIDLLGIARGALVVSKSDRVDAARVDAVSAQLRALVADTPLADAPLFTVSAVTGAGIAQLRAHLEAQARQVTARAGGMFRLAIDRAFTLPGAGVVVTGTVYAGSANVNDQLLISPAGIVVRVRSIHAHNRVESRARAGERCGINIVASQLNKDDIERGQWLLAPPLHAPTQRIDVQMRLLTQARPLAHWAHLQLHLAAAHVMARLVPLESEALQPGTVALAQLVLDKPVAALNGDRLVVRDPAAQRTIGGGIVLDCSAPLRQRKTQVRLAQLRAAQHPEPLQRLVELAVHAPLGIALTHYGAQWNLEPQTLQPLPATLRRVGSAANSWAFDASAWAVLKRRAVELLAAYHAQEPDELGVDGARLRRMLAPHLDAVVFAALIDELLRDAAIGKTGPWLHLPQHSVELQSAERELAQRVLPLVSATFDPPWVRELAQMLGVEDGRMRLLLLRLTRRGEVYQVTRDLFYSAAAVRELARIAHALQQRDGEIRAARFRDEINIGRKRAIQILEFFDRIGYTRRAGEAHRVRSESLLQLGDTR